MLAKKLGFLLMMVLFLVALVQTTPVSARRCSGDLCGCGIAAQECRDACGGVLSCVRACNRESIECSKACCSL